METLSTPTASTNCNNTTPPPGPTSNTWRPILLPPANTFSIKFKLIALLQICGLPPNTISLALQNFNTSDVPSHQIIKTIFAFLNDSQKDVFSNGLGQIAVESNDYLSPANANAIQSSLMYCNYLKTTTVDLKATFLKLPQTVTSLPEFAVFRDKPYNAALLNNLLAALSSRKTDISIMKPILETLGTAFFFLEHSGVGGSESPLEIFEMLMEFYSLKLAHVAFLDRTVGTRPNLRDSLSLSNYIANNLKVEWTRPVSKTFSQMLSSC